MKRSRFHSTSDGIEQGLAGRLTLLSLAFFACVLSAMAGSGETKPNLLFVLADDLGIGDPRCYRPDSKIPTPTFDRLAREGMRFTEAYCPVSVCSPTRYALLTGSYPWRSWKKRGVLANWDPPMIEAGTTTLAAMLRDSGYHTIGIGKWHLGADYATLDGKPPLGKGKFKSENTGANLDLSKPITGGPTDRGFDEWWGFVCASEQIVFDGDQATAVLGHDLYDPPAAPGIDRLRTIPLVEYLPELTRRATDFLSGREGKDDPFFLYFAPYVPHIPLAVEDRFLGSTGAGDYGDYVHALDHYLGEILDTLDRTGLAENTMVVFASDNGCEFRETGDGHIPNAPYAGTKWTIREGGVRTPLLVRWPGVVTPGSTSDALVGLNDWTATVAELVEQESPESARDSLSILKVLRGEREDSPRESLILQSSRGVFALRRENWKYVDGSGDGRDTPPKEGNGQLYDLAADPGETKDLFPEQPERAEELARELREALEASGATR